MPKVASKSAHILQLKDRSVDFILQRSRRRTIGLRISPQGLVIQAPHRVAWQELQEIVQSKAEWVLSKLEQRLERQSRARQLIWQSAASDKTWPQVMYLGHWLDVQFIKTSQRAPPQKEMNAGPHGDEPQLKSKVEQWLKTQALVHFESRCAHYADLMQVSPHKIQLTSAKTRWGSASANRVIRLNWRLIHFDEYLIDYVVVHELAHLHEMNHSPRFWKIVEMTFPTHQDAKRKLLNIDLSVLFE
jgi:predicted metal-dependent hydrolase